MLLGRRCSLKRLLLIFLIVTVSVMLVNFFKVEQLPLQEEQLSVKKHFLESVEDKHPVTSEPQVAIFREGIVGNYEPPAENIGWGPGERGRAVSMTSNMESVSRYGCDMTVSDKISLDRTIPDTRASECKFWHYPSHLPRASVILVFYNEGNSTLLRTVHSVINRTPPSLLVEIVLVDDGSTMEHLKQPLELYIRRFNGKVKLYRNEERLGLIGARMRGATEAIGDVIVVLDSHCECNVNWLPPLLQRIALNRTALVQPTVDLIAYDSFKYVNLFENRQYRGVFDWSLLYKEMDLSQEQKATRKHVSEPFATPTHAGGLFAVDRKYFFEIGGYDPNLLVWGGENFQLSFKIWMCGGRVEMVPCSRVGHVYHHGLPYSLRLKGVKKMDISYIKHNYLRVVEGWMDEYREYYYIREPTLKGHYVNVTDQLNLRKRLGCKSFDWYMRNVAKGMLDVYSLPVPNKSWGNIKERFGRRCLRSPGSVGMCYPQVYRYNTAGQIASGEYCMRVEANTKNIHFSKCPSSTSDSWDWNEKTGLIRHPDLNLCIQSAEKQSFLTLAECDVHNKQQQWDMMKLL